MFTHCDLVTPYGDKIWVNSGSGNGWFPGRQQAIPWTNVDLLDCYHTGDNTV